MKLNKTKKQNKKEKKIGSGIQPYKKPSNIETITFTTRTNKVTNKTHWNKLNTESRKLLTENNKKGVGNSIKHCIIHYTNGDLYNGDYDIVLNNKIGYGVMTYENAIYKGNWVNDLKHGEGKMMYHNKKGEKDDVYIGNWENDSKNGEGKMTYKNGDIYEGEWRYDEKKGEGMMTYETSVYHGEWENDKKNGNGIMIYQDKDGKEEEYDGEWKNDIREGEGQMKYADGKIYKGKWKNDKEYHPSPPPSKPESKQNTLLDILNSTSSSKK